jgi:outer membrane protein assembly factor BamB
MAKETAYLDRGNPEQERKDDMTRAWWTVLAVLVAASAFGGVVENSGVKGGIIVRVGFDSGEELAALRINDKYLVHGLHTDGAKLSAARRSLRDAGQYGQVSAYKFDGKALPYADNLVNLVVISDSAFRIPQSEIDRVLAPGGVAIVNGKKTVKPVPDTIDEWTHFLHGPDNNAVARDSVIHSPRSIQWVSGPRWGRSHEQMASMSAAVTAKGRLFYIVDTAPLAFVRFGAQWELVACDAFNGTRLWSRPIPKWSDHLRHFRAGPLHLPRRLVTDGDTVYVTLGLDAPVTALDAVTGKTLQTFKGTERTDEILVKDGVLYLVVGTSEVYRTGGGLRERGESKPTDFRYITAIYTKTGEPLWRTRETKDEFILPLTLTAHGDSLFYQSTAGIVRLDAASGKQLWKTPRMTPLRRMSFSGPTVVATDEVLLCADRNASEKDAARGKVEWGVHGWNEGGFARKGATTLRAYAVKDGKELWSVPCTEGYNSPVDVFVVGDVVWAGLNFKGYDLKTGEVAKTIQWQGPKVGMPHHRCYRNKATESLILTGRSGIEVVSMEKGNIGNNSWIRGTCQYGVLPANGLIYAPPDACACFLRVKLPGLFAAGPHRNESRVMEFSKAPALEKGAAYGKVVADGSAAPGAWPTYRADASRSGGTADPVSPALRKRWSAKIGGRLTQSVIVGDRIFVAATDAHTVHALNAADGKTVWSYTAGGRVDSAPTLYKGAVLFGCADGWVYALRASDGELAWRFRAAPQERLVGAYAQLESVWPVHGAVLVQNDTLYALAGRSSYIDGGMVLYRLNPVTGEELSRTSLYDLDPETDIQKAGEGGFDMQGTTSDVLTSDGSSVYCKHIGFDSEGQRMTGATKPHLFAAVGLLGEEWFVRSYWLRGTMTRTGWGGWANVAREVPAGRILSFRDDTTYGYGRVTVASGATGHKADAYHLFSKGEPEAPKPAPKPAPAAKGKGKKRRAPKKPAPKVNWSNTKSPIVRAMVLAGDSLVIAGPPDVGQRDPAILSFTNEEDAIAAFNGEKGVLLQVASAADGKVLSESKLEAMPVFDGISSAGGKVFISLKNGTVQCWQ